MNTIAKDVKGGTGMNSQLGSRVGHVAIEAGINFVLPLLIYDRMTPYSGNVVALMASSVPPLLWSLAELVRKRHVDALSVLVLTGIALSLLAMLGGGSARFLQLRENLISGLIGLVFAGSAAIGRPLIYHLARAGIARKSPDEVAAFQAKRNTPHFHSVMMVMTLVWGLGLLASSALACALVFTLSIHDYMIASPVVSYGFMGMLGLWTLWYRRRVHRRAEQGQSVPPAPVS
ncbi:hypothetical protein DFI02_13014 [Rhizobium sp. PP-F2F-G20b]|nr:hypothetical protein DFI02_13014 [Rhizobium sp. PP-F2F-G20b]